MTMYIYTQDPKKVKMGIKKPGENPVISIINSTRLFSSLLISSKLYYTKLISTNYNITYKYLVCN